jgi:hypothetical protein
MLHYPKIPGSRDAPLGKCIAFEKYDGTNLHWEWEREFGWHSFGTRRDAFNLTAKGMEQFAAQHAHLSQAGEVFHALLADGLERVFVEHPVYRQHSFKVFAEFPGPSSFAGLHNQEEAKELRLFDVWSEEFGFVDPHEFVSDFGHLNAARVVDEGKLTGRFAEDVRIGKYDVAEGVICKGLTREGEIWMVKIKTYAYQERLKQALADRWEEFWE